MWPRSNAGIDADFEDAEVFTAGGWLAAAVGWAFVALRALHMREHLGRNQVRVRFNLYVLSTALMWLLWMHLAVVLLRA
jgi:hypothetical protein